MAGYNAVNGATMTESGRLLREILKDEWGFGGVALSDWHAARTTEATAAAGLDLAMPGPDRPWGDRLAAAVRSGQVTEDAIDDKVLRVLRLARHVGAFPSWPPDGHDGHDGQHGTRAPDGTRRADLALLRRAAAASFTLLANPAGTLPLDPGTLGRLAVIGPNAVYPVTQGGGSAAVNQVSVPDPAGWDDLPDGVGWGGTGRIVLRARFRATSEGPHLLGAGGVGHLTLTVDGTVVAEGATPVPADPVEAMVRPGEIRATLPLRAGQQADIEVALLPENWAQGPVSTRLGVVPAPDEDALLDGAVRAARGAGAAIVIVGSGPAAESEGFDRPGLALTGRQDELVRRVAAVNDRTIVVVNAGMPVLMPWAGEVAAVGYA